MFPRSGVQLKTIPYLGELPRWLNLALRVSEDSTHDQFKMGCVIVKSGSILALAANHHQWGRHCEKRALSRIDNAEGSTIYVMRANRRISKPCFRCLLLLKEKQIRKAVYINRLGQIEECRV